MDSFEDVKKALGSRAALLVEEGMTVGLGTGSTARWAIESLAERVRQGLRIQVVSSSVASEKQAQQLGLPFADINAISSVDISIDGADEMDPKGRLIKGAGGALFREKIIASMSKKSVIIIDESKLVDQLGQRKPLPVEVVPFAFSWIKQEIEKQGFSTQLRLQDNQPYITDNGNLILDLQMESHSMDSIERITSIPGVVETGLFVDLVDLALIGDQAGDIQERSF